MPSVPPARCVLDDRSLIESGDEVLLIIEAIDADAEFLLEQARSSGLRGVVAPDGSRGLELAHNLTPDAIALDLDLPDMDGWVLLDRLKRSPKTRHIPVQVISSGGGEMRAMAHGALAFLEKPVEADSLQRVISEVRRFLAKRRRHLLVVEDDEDTQAEILELVGNSDVRTTIASGPEEALTLLDDEGADCLLLDPTLPEDGCARVLDALGSRSSLKRVPTIVYANGGLSPGESEKLRGVSSDLVVRDAQTPEQLLEQTALFLHRPEASFPEEKRELLRALWKRDPALAGKTVLVVDDDVRNIYAITAILESHAVQVVSAENGDQALERLRAQGGADLVLMDIMMPGMDGYEATRRIRAEAQHAGTPIIALTAKAMHGDREKCLEAGASDYITKPVDPDQLLSLLRVWIEEQAR